MNKSRIIFISIIFGLAGAFMWHEGGWFQATDIFWIMAYLFVLVSKEKDE